MKRLPWVTVSLTMGLICLCGCNSFPPKLGNAVPESQRGPATAPAPVLEPATDPSTISPAASPTTPAAAERESWQVYEADNLSIRLPAGWQAERPSTLLISLPEFRQEYPELYGLLGGAGAQAEAVFSSRSKMDASSEFVDNLTIRRAVSDGNGREDIQETAANIAAQYRQLGFDVEETTARLESGGLPAALIVYTFPSGGEDDQGNALGGLQALVATPSDLWILTYTTEADRFATLLPSFEESALSFKVK